MYFVEEAILTKNFWNLFFEKTNFKNMIFLEENFENDFFEGAILKIYFLREQFWKSR